MSTCSSRKGGALLAVLWLSAGLSAIALSVAGEVRSETDRVSTSADGLRASYLASGAVERAILWMTWGTAQLGYSNPDGYPRFWAPGLPRLTMAFPSGDAVVEVIPESAKLNINTASADDIYRVVFAVSGDPARARQISDAIVDWRTPQTSPTLFDSYYLSIAPTFRARHASFEEIEELLLVRGMSPELFYGNYAAEADGRLYARGGLRDCFSVWGSLANFSLNSASPALMEAFGIPAATAQDIVARRQAAPFRKPEELGMPIPPRFSLGNGITIYTLRAAARLRDQSGKYTDVVRSASATVKLFDQTKNPKPLDVLRWSGDAWSQSMNIPYPGMVIRGGNTPGQPGFMGDAAR